MRSLHPAHDLALSIPLTVSLAPFPLPLPSFLSPSESSVRLPLARAAHAHASIWDNKRAYAVQVEYTYLALVRARVSRTRVCTQACSRCTPGSVSSSVCTFRANAPACKHARETTTTTTTPSPTTNASGHIAYAMRTIFKDMGLERGGKRPRVYRRTFACLIVTRLIEHRSLSSTRGRLF